MRGLSLPIALVGLGVPLAGGAWSASAAERWPGCDGFDIQPEAQSYCESQGRRVVVDGDHDVKVCESRPGGRAVTTLHQGCEDGDCDAVARQVPGGHARLRGRRKQGVAKRYPRSGISTPERKRRGTMKGSNAAPVSIA